MKLTTKSGSCINKRGSFLKQPANIMEKKENKSPITFAFTLRKSIRSRSLGEGQNHK